MHKPCLMKKSEGKKGKKKKNNVAERKVKSKKQDSSREIREKKNCFCLLSILLLLLLQGAVQAGHDTTLCNRGVDHLTKLLITADSQEQMARLQTAHIRVELLGDIPSELQQLSREVLQQRSTVDRRGATTTLLAEEVVLQALVDTANGEVETSTKTAGHCLGTVAAGRLTSGLTAVLALALPLPLTFALAFAGGADTTLASKAGAAADDGGLVGGVALVGNLIGDCGHLVRVYLLECCCE